MVHPSAADIDNSAERKKASKLIPHRQECEKEGKKLGKGQNNLRCLVVINRRLYQISCFLVVQQYKCPRVLDEM